MMGKYHVFELQPGYVEDTCLCTMRVTNTIGFDDVETAMEHLRLTIVEYLKPSIESRKQCCKDGIQDTSAKYCSQCGTGFQKYREGVSGESVRSFFMKLPMSTVDSAADILHYFINTGNWDLCGDTYYCPDPNEVPVKVISVGRWMAREDVDDFPYMEGDYPDGSHYCSYDGRNGV